MRRSFLHIAFFNEGEVWDLGGNPGFLAHTMRVLGVQYQTSFGAPGNVAARDKNEAERDAKVEMRARMMPGTAEHVAFKRGWNVDVVRAYQERDYLRLDEIKLKGSLSGDWPYYNMSECFPLWCGSAMGKTDSQKRAYRALELFLWALDRETVSSEVLLEFAFDFQESEGNKSVRQNWMTLWR